MSKMPEKWSMLHVVKGCSVLSDSPRLVLVPLLKWSNNKDASSVNIALQIERVRLYNVLLEETVLSLVYYAESQKVFFDCWHASFLVLASFRGPSCRSERQVKQAKLWVREAVYSCVLMPKDYVVQLCHLPSFYPLQSWRNPQWTVP